MNNEKLERGQKLQRNIQTVELNLEKWKDKETNPTPGDLFWHGSGISQKATEQIREIAIKSLISTRRSLKREFNKL